MLSYQTTLPAPEGINIIGVGGTGANVLRHLCPTRLDGVRLFCTALDSRFEGMDEKIDFIQLGASLQHGLGSGGDPSIGKTAALRSLEDLHACILDSKLIILVCGLGGGTGSGVAPVIAEMAELAGTMLAAVVVMPFSFEGDRRREQAELALADIRTHAHVVLCFENDEMENLMPNYGSAKALFEASAAMLAKAASCIPMIVTKPGLINMGLDDLKASIAHSSNCLFSSAEACGEHRHEQLLESIFQSPMMSPQSLEHIGNKLLVHLTGDEELSLKEIYSLLDALKAKIERKDIEILFGLALEANLGDCLKLNLLAAYQEDEDLIEDEHQDTLINKVQVFLAEPEQKNQEQAEQGQDTRESKTQAEQEPEQEQPSKLPAAPQVTLAPEPFTLLQTPESPKESHPAPKATPTLRITKAEKQPQTESTLFSFLGKGSLFNPVKTGEKAAATIHTTEPQEVTKQATPAATSTSTAMSDKLGSNDATNEAQAQAQTKASKEEVKDDKKSDTHPSPYDEYPYPEPEFGDNFGEALDTPPSMRRDEGSTWAH